MAISQQFVVHLCTVLPIFPGAAVLANSHQGQTVQCSHNQQKPKSYRFCRPQLTCITCENMWQANCTKPAQSAQTCHTNCQTQWWRGKEFGLVLEPGDLAVIRLTINSSVNQCILDSNVKPSVWQPKVG